MSPQVNTTASERVSDMCAGNKHVVPHQLCHGNISDDFSKVLLDGSANTAKDASNAFEASLKPSMANVKADLAAGSVGLHRGRRTRHKRGIR